MSKNVDQARFEVFDGPGGGPVDTRIWVNPGDTVTVSARGQIWSGVAFSAPHGPGGWDWIAGSEKPLPGAKVYCLIIKFGSGGWQEAQYGRWEGTVDANSRGSLILGINDDNPYHGDPNRRWEVFVSVTRRMSSGQGVNMTY
jgi:hypothetical protein